jgi:hypothetical protein
MDPWTALGIAASILQFVDVGCEICSGAKEIYESAEGAKKETAELRLIVSDIQTQNARLIDSKTLSNDEKDLKGLVTKSLELAEQLERILRKLTVRENARFRMVESARISFGAMRNSKDIASLKTRLLDLQRHLQQRLALILQASVYVTPQFLHG